MALIKVLVVDDSFFMRRVLTDILNSDPQINVVSSAANFEEAMKKLDEIKPDVVLLDVIMPTVSGVDILYAIMKKRSTPTIMISSYTKLESQEVVKAFSYGAVDFIEKPEKFGEMDKVKDELIALVKVAATAEIKNLIIPRFERIFEAPKVSNKLIIIAASSGGPPAIDAVLSSLPLDFPAGIIVVQHMPAGFTKSFAERLNASCPLKIKEAENNELIEPGKVLVAPGGYSLEFKKIGKDTGVILSDKGKESLRPSVDVTLESAAKVRKENIIVVVLSGMGKDGAIGVNKLKKQKSNKIIVQDEETALIYGMPKAIADEGNADFILPLNKIPKKITQLL